MLFNVPQLTIQLAKKATKWQCTALSNGSQEQNKTYVHAKKF